MRRLHILVIITFIVFILACCKKEKPKPTIKLNQELKNYTVFLEGSYWVYKHESQNFIDTNKIIKSSLGIILDNDLNYIPEQHESLGISTYYVSKIYLSSDSESRVEDVQIQRIWFDGTITSTKCMFFSNKAVGDTYNYWYYPDNIVTYQSYLPTYTLEGKTYNEVMVFESRYMGASVPFDDVRLPVKVWYAKHIGIIRKEMKNGDVWNLIHHDVKQ